MVRECMLGARPAGDVGGLHDVPGLSVPEPGILEVGAEVPFAAEQRQAA